MTTVIQPDELQTIIRDIDRRLRNLEGGNQATFILGGNFGYQMVDPTFNARCRFNIPLTLIHSGKATLTMSLQPFRSGAASGTSSSTSGGASADHNHSVPGLSVPGLSVPGLSVPGLSTPNHSHDMFRSGGTGTATGSNYTDGGGIVTQIWTIQGGTIKTYSMGAGTTGGGTTGGGTTGGGTTGGGTTGGRNVDHTHTIPGSSLSVPNSLYETGMARDCHVLIDGVDRTVEMGGPWGTGAALDITELDVSTWLNSVGWHEVQITSTQIGGIFAQVAVYATLGA